MSCRVMMCYRCVETCEALEQNDIRLCQVPYLQHQLQKIRSRATERTYQLCIALLAAECHLAWQKVPLVEGYEEHS